MTQRNKAGGWFAITFLFFSIVGYTRNIETSLFINRGQMPMVKVAPKDDVRLPYIAFNTSATFSSVNATISLVVGDSLIITLTNNDNIVHGFTIQATNVNHTVAPGQTIVIRELMKQWGCLIFYDPLDYPKNVYLGLASTIAVEEVATTPKYHWNIKEHSAAFSTDLAKNISVNWETYYPEYFTCNSLSYPESKLDTLTSITAKTGDKILIYMANTGQSDHAIHFHGYHCKILQTNKNKRIIGFSKDSFPLEPMQTMVLELILYNQGEYPVHDHNLITMTGKSVHPFGMLLMIKAE